MSTRFQRLGSLVNKAADVSDEQLAAFAAAGGSYLCVLLYEGEGNPGSTSPANLAGLDAFRDRAAEHKTAGTTRGLETCGWMNCFSGDQGFLTRTGVKTFAETVGTAQEVLNADGRWVNAKVRSFGKQRLSRVTLRPGESSRSHVTVIVRVTAGHRWPTVNRGMVTDLRRGDHIAFQPPARSASLPAAFLAGFGFGDGTLSEGRARIRLCGKKARLLPLFEDFGHCSISHPPSFSGDPFVTFRGGMMNRWKEIPHDFPDADWIAEWLDGYLAADGHFDKRDQTMMLASVSKEAIDFVQQVAPLAGWMVRGRSYSAARETNFGVSDIHNLRLRRAGVWRVTAIDQDEVEEVYCVTEPRTGQFVLASGALTGNCFGGDYFADAQNISQIVHAHALPLAMVDLEAAYQYPAGPAWSIFPDLVARLRDLMPKTDLCVTTDSLGNSKIWNGRTLHPPRSFNNLGVRVSSQSYTWMAKQDGAYAFDKVMQNLKRIGLNDGNFAQVGGGRGVPLSFVHPVLEATGLEGGDLASEIKWLGAARQYGFTNGWQIFDLENVPAGDWPLVTAQRGKTFLV